MTGSEYEELSFPKPGAGGKKPLGSASGGKDARCVPQSLVPLREESTAFEHHVKPIKLGHPGPVYNLK
jgi:hypothetical protein